MIDLLNVLVLMEVNILDHRRFFNQPEAGNGRKEHIFA